MQEENQLILSQHGVQSSVCARLLEHCLDFVKYPGVQHCSILSKIFKVFRIMVCVHMTWHCPLFEHWEYIWTAPTPCVPAAIEDTVEVDRVQLPARHHRRNVFI